VITAFKTLNLPMRLLALALVAATSFIIMRVVITLTNPESLWTKSAVNAPSSTRPKATSKNFSFTSDPFNIENEGGSVEEDIIDLDVPETTLNLKMTGRVVGDEGSAILRTANNQRAAAYFLSRGHHETLLRGLIKSNRKKREVLLESLADYLPDWHIAPNQGGSSVWVSGPSSLDARELAKLCLTKGVLIEPGNVHYMSKERPYNKFRLGYTSIDVGRIDQGVKIIAELAHQLG